MFQEQDIHSGSQPHAKLDRQKVGRLRHQSRRNSRLLADLLFDAKPNKSQVSTSDCQGSKLRCLFTVLSWSTARSRAKQGKRARPFGSSWFLGKIMNFWNHQAAWFKWSGAGSNPYGKPAKAFYNQTEPTFWWCCGPLQASRAGKKLHPLQSPGPQPNHFKSSPCLWL